MAIENVNFNMEGFKVWFEFEIYFTSTYIHLSL